MEMCTYISCVIFKYFLHIAMNKSRTMDFYVIVEFKKDV